MKTPLNQSLDSLTTALREEMGALSAELQQREDCLGVFLRERNEALAVLRDILELDGELTEQEDNRCLTDRERTTFRKARAVLARLELP